VGLVLEEVEDPLFGERLPVLLAADLRVTAVSEHLGRVGTAQAAERQVAQLQRQTVASFFCQGEYSGISMLSRDD
jgi:hypothetical protein